MQASGIQTPIISIVDVASSGGDFPTALTNFSKSRTLNLTNSPFERCQRNVDYHNWLTQCLDHPYLRTILNGNREVYQADGVDRVPAIQMQLVMKNTGTTSSSSPYLGIIRIRTTYEFRGRRLDDEELKTAKSGIIPVSLDTSSTTDENATRSIA